MLKTLGSCRRKGKILDRIRCRHARTRIRTSRRSHTCRNDHLLRAANRSMWMLLLEKGRRRPHTGILCKLHTHDSDPSACGCKLAIAYLTRDLLPHSVTVVPVPDVHGVLCCFATAAQRLRCNGKDLSDRSVLYIDCLFLAHVVSFEMFVLQGWRSPATGDARFS